MKRTFNTIENNIKVFGHLFSDLHIRRKNGEEYQDIHVPINYMGKERMFYLINNSQVDLNSPKISIVLPSMGYNLTDINPDWERLTNPHRLIKGDLPDGLTEIEINKIPVKIGFNLTVAAIHQTDMYNILEQIFTWFRPSYTFKARLNPLIEDKSDINILLESGEYADPTEEAPFSETPNKPLIYTFKFVCKTWVWTGNDDDSGFSKTIKEIELGVFAKADEFTKEELLADSSYTRHIPEHIG